MKNQALFSSKDKSKKLKCRLLQFLFVASKQQTKIAADDILIFLIKRRLLQFFFAALKQQTKIAADHILSFYWPAKTLTK